MIQYASGPWGAAHMEAGAAEITSRAEGVVQLMLTHVLAVTTDALGIQRMYKLDWKDSPIEAAASRQAQARAAAAPSPPLPLSYLEFHQFAATQALKYCPKAKLVTDCSADCFFLWLEHAGCKVNCAVRADGMCPEALIAAACVELCNAVAARELA